MLAASTSRACDAWFVVVPRALLALACCKFGTDFLHNATNVLHRLLIGFVAEVAPAALLKEQAGPQLGQC